jgi:hypothetical protein
MGPQNYISWKTPHRVVDIDFKHDTLKTSVATLSVAFPPAKSWVSSLGLTPSILATRSQLDHYG